MSVRHELRRILEVRITLTLDESRALMQRVLAGEASEIELAALLGGMAARGETAEEIAGFALALRDAAHMLPLTQAERAELVDTCGTGGDASGSLNISTAAALVAAAAGAKVAKHGNRAITSKCGSADVLEALGIPVDLSAAEAANALRKHGFVFLLAPAHHPALKAVMPVRKALGVRTVLHVLGPLLNPAGARRQVMGVYAKRLVPVVGEALRLLGATHAMVVHGDGGSSGAAMDELALSGPSDVAEVRGEELQLKTVAPEDFGLTRAPLEALTGGDAAINAALLCSIFSGANSTAAERARREVVLLNAGAVLLTAGIADSLKSGIAAAADAVDSGKVIALTDALRRQ
jgi:anthranilate phosphoribosyltransferase